MFNIRTTIPENWDPLWNNANNGGISSPPGFPGAGDHAPDLVVIGDPLFRRQIVEAVFSASLHRLPGGSEDLILSFLFRWGKNNSGRVPSGIRPDCFLLVDASATMPRSALRDRIRSDATSSC